MIIFNSGMKAIVATLLVLGSVFFAAVGANLFLQGEVRESVFPLVVAALCALAAAAYINRGKSCWFGN